MIAAILCTLVLYLSRLPRLCLLSSSSSHGGDEGSDEKAADGFDAEEGAGGKGVSMTLAPGAIIALMEALVEIRMYAS